MSDERSLQGVIQAAITAEDAGVAVNWKALCLQVYQVSMDEIKRLTELLEENAESEEVTTQDVMDVLATQETDD